MLESAFNWQTLANETLSLRDKVADFGGTFERGSLSCNLAYAVYTETIAIWKAMDSERPKGVSEADHFKALEARYKDANEIYTCLLLLQPQATAC